MLAWKNKQLRKKSIILVGLFLLLAIGAAVYGGYIYHFNHVEREYYPDDYAAPFSLTISPRSGPTDSWVKRVEENGKTTEYYGTIYDVTIENTGEHTISQWSMTIPISQDCYLNNAWCGTFDVHQNVDKNEIVQNVDLRNYHIEDLQLDYQMKYPDLMIPLAQGDYLEYQPDAASNECPIAADSTTNITSVVFGMIFYTTQEKPLVFTNYHVHYYLQQNFTHGWAFAILALGCFIWIILFTVFASVEWNMKKTHERFQLNERIIGQSIGVFTHFFEAKDIYTTGHSQRVAAYSMLLAEKLGFSEDECRQVYYIALMHDCGKCYIPDEILKKPGKLTPEEYEIIKSHTVKGAEMLVDFTSIDHIRDGVLYHHERYDGTGYPEGLDGENIPLISRIICISDSFDAMNSKRCYREMRSREYIISELKNGSGKQFDPRLVPAFLALIEEGKIRFHDEKSNL